MTLPEVTIPLHAPELAPGVWVQGPPVSIAAARGSVILIDFWEASCANCLRTLPYLIEWHRRYAARGLVTIGVHSPEFEFGKSPEVVAAAVAAEGIPYPVLLDADYATWRRFANHVWPAKYLIDAAGYIRWEQLGEGGYGGTERFLQSLLAEAGDGAEMPEPMAPLHPEDEPGALCYPATGELYLGYHRGRLAAGEGYRPEEEVRHAAGGGPPLPGMFAARGLWYHAAEYLETRARGAELELNCDAASVNLVLAPAGELELEAGGAPMPGALYGADVVENEGRAVASWDRPRMVSLLSARDFARRRLLLRFRQPGIRAYAFTFGTCARP